MIWKSESKFINSPNVCQFIILQGDRQINYRDAISLWQQDASFRTFFNSVLADCSYQAYFWETPPITIDNCDRPFEFVLVNNSRLANVSPNQNSFKQYFTAGKDVITFSNLRKDALLIVPSPLQDPATYTHIAAFVCKAPKAQQHLLWQILGKAIEQQLSKQPLWVSTSGLGVSWLHIRLDSVPKYYSFKPYVWCELNFSK